jgi:sugar O-acyltransferase (sialic acid O-acetyltransferase NeuD family)
MNKTYIGIVGAGGFGREVAAFAFDNLLSISPSIDKESIDLCFVVTTDSTEESSNDLPICSLEKFISLQGEKYYSIAIADARTRQEIAKRMSFHAKAMTLKHHTALSLAGNLIGEGAILCPYSIITANATIGKHFHANLYSYVAHDCVIGDYVTFAPAVRCNGNVHIEDFAYIGTGAVIKQGSKTQPLVIGQGAVVGMGAVVTKSVPPGVTVVGNPARPLIPKLP